MLIEGFENYDVSENGVVTNVKSGRILKPDLIWDGYERVTLCSSGLLKRFRVHRLVASAYIPNPNNYPVVNHKDSVRNNNNVTNLEWSTVKNNRNHGHIQKGEDVVWSRLTDDIVHKVCELIALGVTRGRVIDQIPEVNRTQFDDIRRRKSWKHISNYYNWV